MDWHLSPRSRITEGWQNQPRVPKGMPAGGQWAKVKAIFDSVTASKDPNTYGRTVSSVKAMLGNDRLRQASHFRIPEDPDFYENLSRDEVVQLDLMLSKHGKSNPIDIDRLAVPPALADVKMTDAQRMRASVYSSKDISVLRPSRDLPTGTIVFSWRDGRNTSRVGISPDGSLHSYYRGEGWSVLEQGAPDAPVLRDDRSAGDMLRAMFGEPDKKASPVSRFPPATQKRIDKVLAFARDNGMEIDYRDGMIDIHLHAEDDQFYRDYTSKVTYYIQRVGKRTVAKRYVPATGEDEVIAVDQIIDDMRRALAGSA